ncbi:FAD-dependent oxidoreductase [Mesonia sp.]|uniref:NAD(P)/FAD-dependent oxidoreductase n=1 Tax=Mesonia sp. TaxID=1960830 RepID=UPI001776B381|nr:FAD-dependent oxidoreductase [Mesonia sp.]HIB37261.1 FAD-binding oxidoreductase [Mesonia sp.]HIO26977.1 FAD-binding oxidoreductase [Flavobacteriaceae bacterium]
MNLSYWEKETWLKQVDFTIIGSGITGLNCALQLKKDYPAAKILILERGTLPYGASTKNAGFACFGSVSEILDDLKSLSEQEVFNLIEKRIKGLKFLRENLGDHHIDFKNYGGYELFMKEDETLYQNCLENILYINQLLSPLNGKQTFKTLENKFSFHKVQPLYIFNNYEGQIDTGKMMISLLNKVQQAGIKILNGVALKSYVDSGNKVYLQTNRFEFNTRKLFIATNAFSKELGISKVKPGRAQVLITKPINNLSIKGTFHLDRGYYYFRNINNRILLGGGRNLDINGEETSSFGETDLIQDKLENILKEIIFPKTSVEVEHRWSGIMGLGSNKLPILKTMSNNVFAGVRLGGMGVAIGSLVGKELADLLKNE